MLNELDIKKCYAEANYMYMAIIELTTCCNWRCSHCFINEHSKYGLETKEIYDLLDQLRIFGVYEIQFTGGEIFVREDILEIISYARKLKFKVILLTNTSLLNEKIIKCLDDLCVEVVSTTLFSLKDKINDRITGAHNSASKVLENVNILSKTNIRTEIKTIVMHETELEYKEIQKYCSERHIDFLATEGLFPMYDGDALPRRLALTESQLCNNIMNLDCIRFGKLYREEKSDEKPICCELQYSLFFASDGNIYPCNLWFKKIGNIKTNKVKDIWNSEFLSEVRKFKWKDLHICSSCENKSFCIRCSGVIDAVKGSPLLWDEFSCRTAQARRKIYEQQISG